MLPMIALVKIYQVRFTTSVALSLRYFLLGIDLGMFGLSAFQSFRSFDQNCMMELLNVPMVGFQCVNQFFTFHQLCQRIGNHDVRVKPSYLVRRFFWWFILYVWSSGQVTFASP